MSSRAIAIAVVVIIGAAIGYGLGQITGGETALTGGILGALICLVLK